MDNLVIFNEYKNRLFKSIVSDFKTGDIKNRIISIIVTGSFGREEPTYTIEKNKIVLKSDVEIGVIFKSFSNRKYINNLIQQISSKYSEDLNIMPLSYNRVNRKNNFNYTIIPSRKKTLFTYDLYNGSYTLYGEKIIEKKIVTNCEIDIFESKRIIANRIAELNYIDSIGGSNDELNQWKSKIMLAIISSFLVLNNSYCSSYTDQFKKIQNMYREKIDEELGMNVFELYQKSFLYLRKNGKMVNIKDEDLKIIVKSLVEKYNLMDVKTPKVNCIARKIKYILKYLKYKKEIPRFNFENEIISNVINAYINSSNVSDCSKLWHFTLY